MTRDTLVMNVKWVCEIYSHFFLNVHQRSGVISHKMNIMNNSTFPSLETNCNIDRGSVPCSNNGFCLTENGVKFCECYDGYTGEYCQIGKYFSSIFYVCHA